MKCNGLKKKTYFKPGEAFPDSSIVTDEINVDLARSTAKFASLSCFVLGENPNSLTGKGMQNITLSENAARYGESP